jgi:large subunit ribosomal protein L3
MRLGLVGRKVGMTRIFSEDGASVPVTVIDVSNNKVVFLKTTDVDGYTAVQVSFGERNPRRLGGAVRGHLSKAGVRGADVLKEFYLNEEQASQVKVGDHINAAIFSVGQFVDVSGVSIGKGYAGAIKRHNFSSNRASHGNSVSHNSPGSIGMAQDPGRVFPGKRMSGRLGGASCTTQNLKVIQVDEARQVLMLKGAVPGSKGGIVSIVPSVKIRKILGD